MYTKQVNLALYFFFFLIPPLFSALGHCSPILAGVSDSPGNIGAVSFSNVVPEVSTACSVLPPQSHRGFGCRARGRRVLSGR